MVDLIYRGPRGERTDLNGETKTMRQDIRFVDAIRTDKVIGPRFAHLSDFEIVQLRDRWAKNGHTPSLIHFYEGEIGKADRANSDDTAPYITPWTGSPKDTAGLEGAATLFNGENEVAATDPGLPSGEAEVRAAFDEFLQAIEPAYDGPKEDPENEIGTIDMAFTAYDDRGEPIRTETFYRVPEVIDLSTALGKFRRDMESWNKIRPHVRTVIDIAH